MADMPTSSRPVIAITMGDPAGVGPEIVMKALALGEVHDMCRPIVIGDAARLALAAEICGITTSIRVVTDPESTSSNASS